MVEMVKKLPPRRKRPARAREHDAVQSVVDETIALYHWLAWVADELYGDDARGAARRWTLRRLHRDGPQTVPDLAKVRSVRRQSLQPLVDLLVKEGLVELRENPEHVRSSLLALRHAPRAPRQLRDANEVAAGRCPRVEALAADPGRARGRLRIDAAGEGEQLARRRSREAAARGQEIEPRLARRVLGDVGGGLGVARLALRVDHLEVRGRAGVVGERGELERLLPERG